MTRGIAVLLALGVRGNVRRGRDPRSWQPVPIGDRGDDRLVAVDPQGRSLWTFPEAGDLPPGETFRVPDDVLYTPNGRHIVVIHKDDFTITLVAEASLVCSSMGRSSAVAPRHRPRRRAAGRGRLVIVGAAVPLGAWDIWPCDEKAIAALM